MKSNNELVAEIHSKFFNASEAIVGHAKRLALKKNAVREKATRLNALGFTKSAESMELQGIVHRIDLANKVAQYAVKYPLYKFIDAKRVEKICKKYKLMLGEASMYKGSIPEKNLAEIERFNIDDEDRQEDYFSSLFESMNFSFISYIGNRNSGIIADAPKDKEPVKPTNKFKICAPITDMETLGNRIVGHQIIPDPIVLHAVKGGYLIVTAWGYEASDRAIVNEINN